MASQTMDKYTLPAGKSKHEFSVPHVKGLRVCVSTKNKTFMQRYTFAGKKHCVVLGRYPDMDLIEAISKVQANDQKIAQGINPNQSKEEGHSQDVLFRHFTQNIYLPAVKPHKKSYSDDESRIRIHLIPVLGKKKLSDITSAELSQLLANKQQE
ncbi:integrase arm-type DNA-binding domain-containing protein [Acinetobacter rathckeae]|nr:integrase arm-type DNA-binding domain-containing protein [Acinetobacter rathckeae]